MPQRAERDAPPVFNRAPDPPRMPGHRSYNCGHRLRDWREGFRGVARAYRYDIRDETGLGHARLPAMADDAELDDERQRGQRAVNQTAICSHQPCARRSPSTSWATASLSAIVDVPAVMAATLASPHQAIRRCRHRAV
jgi:hypothetical protein